MPHAIAIAGSLLTALALVEPSIANQCSDTEYRPQDQGANKFEWRPLAFPGVDVVSFGDWIFDCARPDASISEPKVRITAIRFNPQRASLELGLTMRRIAKSQTDGEFFFTDKGDAFRGGQNLATLGLGQEESDNKEIALVNASWWLDVDETAVAGLFKVSGEVVSSTVNELLSAVVCLDDRAPEEGAIDYQVVVVLSGYPGGYFAFDRWFVDKYEPQVGPNRISAAAQIRRWERIKRCPSYFQGGPRIVEYDNGVFLRHDDYKNVPSIRCLSEEKNHKAGICDPDRRGTDFSKRRRVVLALDDRGRDEVRWIYLISTEQSISAYQMQKILLRKEFYGGWSPRVAVNLASSEKSGLLIKPSVNDYIISGNVEETIPSYLAVRLQGVEIREREKN